MYPLRLSLILSSSRVTLLVYIQEWTFIFPDLWPPRLDIKVLADNRSPDDPKTCDDKFLSRWSTFIWHLRFKLSGKNYWFSSKYVSAPIWRYTCTHIRIHIPMVNSQPYTCIHPYVHTYTHKCTHIELSPHIVSILSQLESLKQYIWTKIQIQSKFQHNRRN